MHTAITLSPTDLEQRQAYNIRLLTIWFLYTTFSGAVRKWIITDPTTANLLLGVQIIAPLLFVIFTKTNRLRPATVNLIWGFTALLVLMAFNPLNQSLAHGLLGYCLQISVFFPLLVYLHDREAFPIERLNRLFLIIILIEVALGVVQFLSPYDSIVNKYVRDMSEFGGVARLGSAGQARITGTFSYIGGMTSLFTAIGFWVWGARLTRQPSIYIALLLVSCIIISPMTGSRGLTALLIILTICAFLATVNEIRSTIALLLLGGISLAILQITNVTVVGEAYSGLNERVTAHNEDGESRTRIIGQIEEIIDFRGEYPLFGTGLGATYQGAIALFGESRALKEYGYYEEEPERVILEGGFLLFFVRLLFWGVLFRRSTIPLLFSLLLIWLHLFYQVTVTNVFTAFYTVLGLMYLDRSYWLRNQKTV